MDADLETLLEGIEAAFDVRLGPLSDEPTFRDVFDRLCQQIGTAERHRCFASVVFWRLRQTMTEVLQVPREAIQLDTSIPQLVGPLRRRRVWTAIAAESGLALPGLELPLWFALLLLALTLAPVVATCLRNGWVALPVFLVTPFLGAGLFWLARPLAVTLPDHALSMRHLVRTVVGLNHDHLRRELGPSRDRELKKALEYVIRGITGTDYAWVDDENFSLSDLAQDGIRSGTMLV